MDWRTHVWLVNLSYYAKWNPWYGLQVWQINSLNLGHFNIFKIIILNFFKSQIMFLLIIRVVFEFIKFIKIY